MELNNNNLNNYELINKSYIEERELTIYELSHKKTLARVVLFENNDENKVFNIAFKTPVDNEKGTPHILEHSVLCGSKKYDVKDPFIELVKSSMNTFLNAMTYPDKTCYPVASINDKDFDNLCDVYLDAVFYPNIYKYKQILMQEGWHYEFNDKEELSTNGIVLNEMKGVYSDPFAVLETLVYKSIYPNTNYAYESGGNPKDIISLTYDEFIDFHKKYYSPSNAIIYFYGKMDFNKKLEYLNDEYLSKFDKSSAVNFNEYYNIESINKYKYNETIDYYNVDVEDNNNCFLTINYLMNQSKNNLDFIVLNILDYILFNQEGALIKDPILNLGFAENISSNIEFSFVNGNISISFQNIDINNKQKIIDKFNELLNDIINNGIDKNKLLSGINTTYFNFIENDSNIPKGLSLILYSLDSYLYGDKVDVFIKYKESFDILFNEDLSSKDNIFIKTLKKYFINNEYISLSILMPKYNLIKDNEDSFNKKMLEIKKSFSLADIKNIKDEYNNLTEYQNKDDDYSILPYLNKNDIKKEVDLINYNVFDYNNTKNVYTLIDINDLVYYSLNFEIDKISNYEKYLIGILIQLLSKLDTTNYSYVDLNNAIDIYTGSFNIKFDNFNKKLLFRVYIKTLINNLDKSFDLIYEIINNTKFSDKSRVKNILLSLKNDSNRIIPSIGHKVAFNRAMANVKPAFDLIDKSYVVGISFNQFINELINKFDDVIDDLINDLIILLNKIINNKNVSFFYGLDKKYLESLNKFVSSKIDVLLNRAINNINKDYKMYKHFNFDNFERKSKSEAIIINSDVNYIARAGEIKDFNGTLLILKNLLNFEYLWNNIRVNGGAYGTTSTFDLDCFGGFTSFRDPKIYETDQVYINIPKYLESIELTEDRINNLIISAIASIDNPISNHLLFEKSIDYYLKNIDNEYINNIRKEVLDSDINSLKNQIRNINSIIKTNEVCGLISVKNLEKAKNQYDRIIKINEYK